MFPGGLRFWEIFERRKWGFVERMADAEAAMAQSRSASRTYEDAIAAMNTLITRKADMPPPDPRTGELNWNAHFQALFRCIEVCSSHFLG